MGTQSVVCSHCDGGNIKCRRQITSSGTEAFALYCLDCERWAERLPKWIGHDRIEASCRRQGISKDDIPIVADHSAENACAVCGKAGEMHHWAPQALSDQFGDDWVYWPLSPLCVRHHLMWHRIVTPNLSKGE